MTPETLALHLPIIAIFPGLLLTRLLIRRGYKSGRGSGGARARVQSGTVRSVSNSGDTSAGPLRSLASLPAAHRGVLAS